MSLTLGLIVLVNVFISTVKNANTSGWTAAEVALWGTITLAAIAGVVYGTMNLFGLA